MTHKSDEDSALWFESLISRALQKPDPRKQQQMFQAGGFLLKDEELAASSAKGFRNAVKALAAKYLSSASR